MVSLSEYLELDKLVIFRLVCALDGKYLIQEPTHELVDDIDSLKNDDQLQSLNFSCSIATLSGRGFIEVNFFCETLNFSST